MIKTSIDEEYWNNQNKKWDTHRAFYTNSHGHIDILTEQNDYFALTVVKTNDGRYFLVDETGFEDEEMVVSPYNKNRDYVYMFKTLKETLEKACEIVSKVSGESVEKIKNMYSEFEL